MCSPVVSLIIYRSLQVPLCCVLYQEIGERICWCVINQPCQSIQPRVLLRLTACFSSPDLIWCQASRFILMTQGCLVVAALIVPHLCNQPRTSRETFRETDCV